MAAEAESPRLRKLMELARWHDEWAKRHTDDGQFRPEEHPDPDSDYNVHHIDVDPSPDAEAEFMMRAREIMGLDPRTGMPVTPPPGGGTGGHGGRDGDGHG
jgi:hypothetical protein